jgi:hypothetical protein
MSRLLSFAHGDEEAGGAGGAGRGGGRGPQPRTLMREAGLPQNFGKQKLRRKNFGRQQVEDEDEDKEEEDTPEEKARLAALSAKFTPFQPIAIARAAALGAAEAEKPKDEEEAEEDESTLTEAEKRLRALRKKMAHVKQEGVKVRRPAVFFNLFILRPPPRAVHGRRPLSAVLTQP